MSVNCIIGEYKKDGCSSCSSNCAYLIAMEARQQFANVPLDYRDKTLAKNPLGDSFSAVANGVISTFNRQFDDDAARIKSLYLFSTAPGTGKTTTAAILLNEWIARSYIGALKRGLTPDRRPAYFLDVNEWQSFYNKFNRPSVPAEIAEPASIEYYKRLERAKNAPFAVLDDIGVRSASEPFRADLHEVINHRTVNGMPTVYTSNVALSGLTEVFDKRLADRIGDMCAEITFTGNSHRGRRNA